MSFWVRDLFFGLLGFLVLRPKYLRNRLFDLGEVASFQSFVEHFFGPRNYFKSRNSLRATILPEISTGSCRVYEFGVASGDSARWLKKRVNNPDFSYHGWDTFTGLPSDWVRNGLIYRSQGFFDNGGNVPTLNDKRFFFHKGLIEDKLESIRESLSFNGLKVFLFDFDLYDPSSLIWDEILPYLKSNDLIYFDEAFDSNHERKLILEKIIPIQEQFAYVGNTTIALLLRKR